MDANYLDKEGSCLCNVLHVTDAHAAGKVRILGHTNNKSDPWDTQTRAHTASLACCVHISCCCASDVRKIKKRLPLNTDLRPGRARNNSIAFLGESVN